MEIRSLTKKKPATQLDAACHAASRRVCGETLRLKSTLLEETWNVVRYGVHVNEENTREGRKALLCRVTGTSEDLTVTYASYAPMICLNFRRRRTATRALQKARPWRGEDDTRLFLPAFIDEYLCITFVAWTSFKPLVSKVRGLPSLYTENRIIYYSQNIVTWSLKAGTVEA
jgi:hypothetical protein